MIGIGNCVTKSLLNIAQIGEGIRQPKLILTLFNSFPSTWWGENSLGISIWNSKLQALQTKRYTIHRKKNTCLLKFTKMTSENRQFKMHSKLLTLMFIVVDVDVDEEMFYCYDSFEITWRSVRPRCKYIHWTHDSIFGNCVFADLNWWIKCASFWWTENIILKRYVLL